MTDLIFETLAPAFWQTGYSVIPVHSGTKQPAVSGWTGYCNNLPNEQTQKEWLEKYVSCGVALALGFEVEKRAPHSRNRR